MNQLINARETESQIRDFIQKCETPNNEEQGVLIKLLDKWDEINHAILEKGLLVDELIYNLANAHSEILINLLTTPDNEINLGHGGLQINTY